jgi:hypothetical protein
LENKTASGIMLALLLLSTITIAFDIQPVRASETIYIMADGSVNPLTAPIQRDGDIYTFTADIDGSIVVEKDNIIVDGAGYNLQGIDAADSKGIDVPGRNNVVIRSVEISAFAYGVCLNNSRNSRIIGNNITDGAINSRGIWVTGSSNAILRNIISNNFVGIQGSDCNFFGNNVTNNENGLILGGCKIVGNNIVRNSYGVYQGGENIFFHNNFINNTVQAKYVYVSNVWDDGYPSGGNYWSDFVMRYYPDARDVYSGPYQNETGSDGIWDRSYMIESENKDNYPFVDPCVPSPFHELVVSTLATPDESTAGHLLALNTTVTNQGSVDETNVEFLLLINGTAVNSTTIPLLEVDSSYTLSYSWTPAAKGTYNITAYARPVFGERWVENNQQSKFTTVWAVGVKAGDWIKYIYSYRKSPETPYTEWIKVEFLSVEVRAVTIRGTLHLTNGTEQNRTFTQHIGGYTFGPVFDTLTGFVILANSTAGDIAYIGSTDGKPCARIYTPELATTHYSPIEGETEGTYVGTQRTTVYAKYSDFIAYGPLTCYWDKQTGVLMEVSNTRSDGWTAKAIETNMWQAEPSALPVDQTYLYVLAAVAIVIAVGAIAFVMRRKKKPPEVVTPTASSLQMTHSI